MDRKHSDATLLAGGVAGFLLGLATAFSLPGRAERPTADARREAARAQCERWADRLDRDTTAAGVYNRFAGEVLPDGDPWGRPLRVGYSQGGLAEHLEVRSVGPDGESHTADDVVAARQAVNLKGVGNGVKAGAEETAANAARGAVRGAADGLKQAAGLGGRP